MHWLAQSVSSVSSFAQSVWLCDPMNRSTPGLPVHHQLPEFTQTHVHRVSDAIQPCHPLSSPSPPAPNPSQHQSIFHWVNSSHEVAKVLEFQLRLAQGLRKVKFRRNQVSSWQHRTFKRKKSDTCSLFSRFGDPWPSCLLPSNYDQLYGPGISFPTTWVSSLWNVLIYHR